MKQTFVHELEAYKNYLKNEEKSSATMEKYLRDVRTFLTFLGGRKITKTWTCAYKHYLEYKGYATSTINAMLAAINCYVAWLKMEDCKVKTLRVQKSAYRDEAKELTKEEYFCLLEAAKGKPRLHMILETLAGTGIRVSELAYFTVEAVRAGKIEVKCKNKIRVILIPGNLRKKLLNYAKKHKIQSGKIFVTRSGKSVDRSNLWKEMKALHEKVDVALSKIFPHNFRKLFARTFYQMDKDLAKLADILGHSSVETTRIYIMGTGEEHRLQMEQVGLVI